MKPEADSPSADKLCGDNPKSNLSKFLEGKMLSSESVSTAPRALLKVLWGKQRWCVVMERVLDRDLSPSTFSLPNLFVIFGQKQIKGLWTFDCSAVKEMLKGRAYVKMLSVLNINI